VSVANVAARKMLVVVVLDSGRVVHELLEVDTPIDPVRATNFLTSKLAGLALEALDTAESHSAPDDPPMLRDLLNKVLEFLKREAEESEETGIYLGGTSYILQQPEFRDAARLEAVLSALEQRKSLYRLFSSVYLGPGVTVLIGTENPVSDLRQCSFVGARYRIGGRVAGTIGVVGPTRMDYRRAVSAVQYMARNLGELLTDLSLA
jgi:heat-inducible transcriptional repressor